MDSTVDRKPADKLNEKVVLIGTAQNAKAGAVLVLSDGSVVYIKNLDSWDEALNMKVMKVSGILRREKIAPDPTINEKGEISAGMPGKALCLEEAAWKQV